MLDCLEVCRCLLDGLKGLDGCKKCSPSSSSGLANSSVLKAFRSKEFEPGDEGGLSAIGLSRVGACKMDDARENGIGSFGSVFKSWLSLFISF